MSATLRALVGRDERSLAAGPDEVADSVQDTVDVFDAAAHLESMGFGGQVSRRRGYSNTFDHADALVRTRLAGAALATRSNRYSRRRAWQRTGGNALARALTMLCGVLICVATVPQHHASAVFAAGALGWLTGQLVSATMWQGLSHAGRFKAEVNGALVGSVVLVLSGIFCLAVGSWVPLLWAMWGCAISALVVIGAPAQLLAVALPCAALTGALMLWAPSAASIVSRIIVVGFSVATGYIVAKGTWGARDKFRECAREVVHPVLLWSTIQAVGLIAQLAVLVDNVGTAFTLSLSVGGLVASAACELVLDSALLGAKRLALYTGNWRRLRWYTAGLGVLAVSVVCGAGLIAGLFLINRVGGDESQAHVFLPAVLITALATVGSGVQLRTGSALGAALVAVASLCVVLLCLTLETAHGLLLATIILFVSVSAVAARRTSLSANW